AEGGAGLGPLGDVVLDLAVDGGDLHLPAQHRLGEGDGRLAQHVVALPAEELVGPHGDGDQQVACRPAVSPGIALAPQGDGLPVVDAGGDIHMDGLALALLTGAVAVLTGAMNDFTTSTALWASGCGG